MNKLNFLSKFTAALVAILISQVVLASSSILLSWKLPTTRENGRPLAIAELKGYEISYVREDLAVTNAIQVNSGSASSYLLKNLAAGKYYAAVSAIDVNGLKSKFSSSVPFTVDSSAAPDVPISLAVSASASSASMGAIKVSWIAPKTRTDGTALPLNEVSGYNINLYRVYKNGSQIYRAATVTAKGNIGQGYTLNNILKGTYVVLLSATDIDGDKGKTTHKFIQI